MKKVRGKENQERGHKQKIPQRVKEKKQKGGSLAAYGGEKRTESQKKR